MKIIHKIDKMKTHVRIMKKRSRLIGLVPTMGYLHEGHLSLIRAARKQTDALILSIFVNPIQFAPNEDFKKYPRDEQKDEELARAEGVDVLFYPEKKDMYPAGFSTYVNVEGLTEGLCGKSRPGHFRGVTTVVAKLFEITMPDIAYFGQKDAQQAFVINKMVKDLNMDVTLKILPTVREPEGLAMSSRNTYLTGPERADALALSKALKLAEGLINSGEKDSGKIIKSMRALIGKTPSVKIDYIEITDIERMKTLSHIRGGALIAVAAFVGKTRLIDNILVKTETSQKARDYDKLLIG